MKTNLPVTNNEVLMNDGVTIVTKTDLKGIITYANPDFIRISGFGEQELLGQNHNIVRHPDMPPAAFADLWATLKKGKPWTGIVKNRCKNGDFYWVNAHVAPIDENGKTVGYTSIRTKPGRAEIESAVRLYEAVKNGKARLREGAAANDSLISRLNPLDFVQTLSVNAQISLLLITFLAGFALASSVVYSAFNHLQVNGPIYKRVVQGKDLVADILPPPEYLIEAYLVTLEMANADASALPALVERSRKLREEYEQRHQFWMSNLPDGKLKTLMVEDAYQPGLAFLELRDQRFIPALLAGDHGAAQELLPLMAKKYAEHRAVIDEVVELANARNSADERSAAEMIADKKRLLVLLFLGIMSVVGLLGWFISRSVNRLLGGDPRYAREITRHVASGNLGLRIDIDPRDTTSLLASIKYMREMFRQVVKETQANAEVVAMSAQQMAVASDQVRATSQQSSEATASVAASAEGVTVSMGQVVANAQEARNISERSEQTCSTGVAVIHQAVMSMEQIAAMVREATAVVMTLGSQSEQISSVVKVIREIAEQTNLLALNAAIEAARAGEQGRGFAVVADEVRKLAERTTNSTEEIARMISSIQNGMRDAVANMEGGVGRVNEGVRNANEAGEAIKRIQEGAQRVVQVVSDISNALRGQGIASEDIAQHVEHIARMSEDNNAVAQQTSQDAHHLLGAVEKMQNTVSRFAV
jgi:PAS domain S-box-containing protein